MIIMVNNKDNGREQRKKFNIQIANDPGIDERLRGLTVNKYGFSALRLQY